MRQSMGKLAAVMTTEGPWRSIIRFAAIFMAVIGFILIGHEVLENVTCPAITLPGGNMVRAGYCAKMHLSSMLWGIALLSLGLLIIQQGDVSKSLKEAAGVGTVVRSWWPGGRRATDQPVVVEQPVVVAEQPVVVEDHDKKPRGTDG